MSEDVGQERVRECVRRREGEERKKRVCLETLVPGTVEYYRWPIVVVSISESFQNCRQILPFFGRRCQPR